LVGPSGVVVGVDRSAKAIDVAQRRATTGRPRYSVKFVVADLDTFVPDERFDAIIGRLILLYLRDPAATLRRLSAYVRPGGVVAFQEMAMPLARSNPDGAHFRQCSDWILATFARAGVEPDMGGKLFATFLAAGLPIPQMILAGRVEGGPDSLVYDYYADIARSLLPMSKHRSYGSLFSGSTRSGVMAAAGRRHLGNARRAAALRSFEGNGLGRIRSRGE
jgi:SAM-dependent methyltransferase